MYFKRFGEGSRPSALSFAGNDDLKKFGSRQVLCSVNNASWFTIRTRDGWAGGDRMKPGQTEAATLIIVEHLLVDNNYLADHVKRTARLK